jgi:hypothetical protein
MIKFLIPMLLASTFAYGQDELHNNFDPMVGNWDGSLQVVAPQIVKQFPLPVATPLLGNKCTTDDLKVVSQYLHSFGYTALIAADDKSRDNVKDEIMYNINDSSILSLSLFYSHPLSSEEPPVLIKICTEFQGVNTDGDGPTFKKFVLGQHMKEINDTLDQEDQIKRDLSAGKSGPEKQEPYQGDPSKVGYQIH